MPKPRVIKKYPNRRLYDTEISSYITIEDVRQLIVDGEAFEVRDAKSGEDLTRSVLLQIISEHESDGEPVLSTQLLSQIIRFYGDSMRTMVPSFLEFSVANFARDQDGLREKFAHSFGPAAFQNAIEQQVRTNMSFFGDAMKMFTAFPGGVAPGASQPAAAPAPGSDLDDLKRQMAEMQQRLIGAFLSSASKRAPGGAGRAAPPGRARYG